MKLVRATKNKLTFHLGQREESWLLLILKRYPCVPSAHHVLSKSCALPDAEANQQLLNDALAEQRSQNKKLLRTLLADARRFKHTERGATLSLSPAEADWLLQVLNDIRVGSWLVLGSPDEVSEKIDPAIAPHLWVMELAGYFQMQLLEALGGRV